MGLLTEVFIAFFGIAYIGGKAICGSLEESSRKEAIRAREIEERQLIEQYVDDELETKIDEALSDVTADFWNKIERVYHSIPSCAEYFDSMDWDKWGYQKITFIHVHDKEIKRLLMAEYGVIPREDLMGDITPLPTEYLTGDYKRKERMRQLDVMRWVEDRIHEYDDTLRLYLTWPCSVYGYYLQDVDKYNAWRGPGACFRWERPSEHDEILWNKKF